MPEPPIFPEFVGRPDESQHVADTATDDDSSGSEESSKGQGASGHRDRSDHRVGKEDFLLVRAQIISLRKDNHIRDHVDHQHGDRARVEQPLCKTNVLQIKENRP